MGNTNCCFNFPRPPGWRIRNATTDGDDAADPLLQAVPFYCADWAIFNFESIGLTAFISPHQDSNIQDIIDHIKEVKMFVRNFCVRQPRILATSSYAPDHHQPQWSNNTPIFDLYRTIKEVHHLEALVLAGIGTPSNPFPLKLLTHVLWKFRSSLLTVHLEGHFVGNKRDRHQLARVVGMQEKLKILALNGIATPAILKAASQLSTVIRLFFSDTPKPLDSETITQVAAMPQLEVLDIHSSDRDTTKIGALVSKLQYSKSLKAFVLCQVVRDVQDKVSFVQTLCQLLKHNQGIEYFEIWLGSVDDIAIVREFAYTLQQLPKNHSLCNFEAGLVWSHFDDNTAQAFYNMMQTNLQLEAMILREYKGEWRLPIYFYTRLNQTGRKQLVEELETISPNDWIHTLTTIPELVEEDENGNVTTAVKVQSAALEDAPEDPDWFSLSWTYYYLRLNPSICYSHDGASSKN